MRIENMIGQTKDEDANARTLTFKRFAMLKSSDAARLRKSLIVAFAYIIFDLTCANGRCLDRKCCLRIKVPMLADMTY